MLTIMLEMPLDILYEIFGHLLPLDVLHVSWTNKAFRKILLHRSSVTVWKSALSNFRMDVPSFPETPFDLNEPQYVNLIFSEHCHFCTRHTEPEADILYLLRIRCCRQCLPEQYAVLYRTHTFDLLHTLFSIHTWDPFKPWCFDIDRELVPIDSIGRYGKPFFLKSTFEKLQAELPTLTEAELQERRERIARLELSEEELRTWHERADVRREAAIIQKLKTGVWAQEFPRINKKDFFELWVVRQASDLTQEAWKEIEPTLNEFMQAQRAARIKREHPARIKAAVTVVRDLVHAYNLTQPADAILPGLADVCLMPPFKPIITDTPPDVPITPESFRDAMTQLPHLGAQWRADATRRLTEALAASSRMGTAEPELAISLFHRRGSSALFTLREALTYSAPPGGNSRARHPLPDALLGAAFAACGVTTWAIPRARGQGGEPFLDFVRDAGVDGCARDVVAACGQDPDTVTADEMDALDPWVQCRWCLANHWCDNDRNMGMHWRTAVSIDAALLSGSWWSNGIYHRLIMPCK
ncbi:hypothetical protein PLICRDRAFT_370381 [Plicaturopsis crispa FD-325 SS-3]|uniref:F-box domain-containing protein n=1 Tax=Plicaturopsis crispa FD-325 SS-3 TaxID=944288 RepID=A0A0C9SX30_PLICR|nr:hypothetical protein PLICRDRAFT_370381 [Plicaturopsis crispa FD-325 SS-3]